MNFLQTPTTLPHLPEWTPPTLCSLTTPSHTAVALDRVRSALDAAIRVRNARIHEHDAQLRAFVDYVVRLDRSMFGG